MRWKVLSAKFKSEDYFSSSADVSQYFEVCEFQSPCWLGEANLDRILETES